MSAISLIQPDRDLFSWPQYWAACFGPAPFLPMSREEMDQLGWDSCDIILVTGDAYVDHPSFGMAICGRMLEAQGFRVGIISQPDWNSKDDFMRLGKPNLFFGVTAGNMDSMINRYTADRKLRHDDAYTPDNVAGKRPDRATLVYTQRCKEAWKDVPVILGGIDSLLGVFVGGLVVGVLGSVIPGYLDPIVGGGTRDVVTSVLIVLTILFRPYGMFGREDIERV